MNYKQVACAYTVTIQTDEYEENNHHIYFVFALIHYRFVLFKKLFKLNKYNLINFSNTYNFNQSQSLVLKLQNWLVGK